jgi:GNAT superfamily N-acetyltransferase
VNPALQPTIVQATSVEASDASVLIAEAFQHLDVADWLVPEPHLRRQVLENNFRIWVDHAVTHGLVYLTDDCSAVAVWLPRAALPEPPPDYEQRLAIACGDYIKRFRVLGEFFDAHHPSVAHHHLAFLAVHPDRQGQGLGTRLLRHHLAVLDQLNMPAYLEASSWRSRRLYARHAFNAATAFHLPDGPPLWPMWREPQAVVHEMKVGDWPPDATG